MADKKKKTKEEEDKKRAKLLGQGLARAAANATMKRNAAMKKMLEQLK